MRPTYTRKSDIAEKLANREPFHGSSCHATRNGDEYKVYSYATLMYHSNKTGMRIPYVNTEEYSPTTSWLQKLIRKHLLKEK